VTYTIHVYGRVAIIAASRGHRGIDVSAMPRIVEVAQEVCECPDPTVFVGDDVIELADAVIGCRPVMVLGPGAYSAENVIADLQEYR
jgi:hypothetical protein